MKNASDLDAGNPTKSILGIFWGVLRILFGLAAFLVYSDWQDYLSKIADFLPTERGPYAFMTLDKYCAATYQEGSLLGTITTDTGAQQIFCVAPYDGVEITEVLRSGKVVSPKPVSSTHQDNNPVIAINKTKTKKMTNDDIERPGIIDGCAWRQNRLVAIDDIRAVRDHKINITYARVFCLDDTGRLTLLDENHREVETWQDFVPAPQRE